MERVVLDSRMGKTQIGVRAHRLATVVVIANPEVKMERVVLDSRMGKTQIGVRAHRLANQSRPTLRIVAIGLAGIISAAFSWPLAEAQTWPERTTFEVKGLLSERITTVTAPNAVTASFQDGVAPNNAYNGTRDTKIKSDEPTTIFGSDTELEVDGDPDRSVILKWNVSSLPPGSSVHSASITLEVTNASTDSYEIYEMKQDWVEGEADWSQYRSGNTWQTAGAGVTYTIAGSWHGCVRGSQCNRYRFDYHIARHHGTPAH